MLISSIILSSGISCLRFGPGIVTLFIGQFITGFSCQSLSAVIPAYTGELSQPQIRKFTGTLFATFFCTGGAIMFGLSAMFPVKTALLIVLVMAAINFILLLFCPKSPTWLISKGRHEEAFITIKRLRGNEVVAKSELDRLEENTKKQMPEYKQIQQITARRKCQIFLQTLKRPTFLRPFLTLLVLFCIGLHLSGSTTMIIYFIHILKKAEVPVDAYTIAATLALYRLVINVITSIVASKVRRRPLFITSAFIAATGLFMFALFIYLNENPEYKALQKEYPILKWFTTLSIGVIATGNSCGLGMVIFMLLGELLPSDARGLGAGLVLFFNNICWFLMILAFPMLESTLGLYGLFWFFSFSDFSLVVFVYFFIPETFGLTLEGIEDYYRDLCQPKNLRNQEQSEQYECQELKP